MNLKKVFFRICFIENHIIQIILQFVPIFLIFNQVAHSFSSIWTKLTTAQPAPPLPFVDDFLVKRAKKESPFFSLMATNFSLEIVDDSTPHRNDPSKFQQKLVWSIKILF